MRRYLALYYHFFLFSLISRMEYRFDFVMSALRSLGWVGVTILTYTILFTQTSEIAGWSKEEVLVMFGIFMIIDESWNAFFSDNLVRLSDYVRLGELDHILLLPLSTQFFVSLRHVLIFTIPNIIIGFGVALYYLSQLSITISWWQYAISLLLIVNGLFIMYSIMLLFVSLTFWVVQLRAFWDLYEILTYGAKYPIGFYRNPLHFFFLFIIPLGVAFTFPAEFLVKGLSWQVVATAFCVGVGIFVVAHKFFYFGLKQYNSASS